MQVLKIKQVTQVTNFSFPPEGWYEDPQDFFRMRFWDGAQWTNDKILKSEFQSGQTFQSVKGESSSNNTTQKRFDKKEVVHSEVKTKLYPSSEQFPRFETQSALTPSMSDEFESMADSKKWIVLAGKYCGILPAHTMEDQYEPLCAIETHKKYLFFDEWMDPVISFFNHPMTRESYFDICMQNPKLPVNEVFSSLNVNGVIFTFAMFEHFEFGISQFQDVLFVPNLNIFQGDLPKTVKFVSKNNFNGKDILELSAVDEFMVAIFNDERHRDISTLIPYTAGLSGIPVEEVYLKFIKTLLWLLVSDCGYLSYDFR